MRSSLVRVALTTSLLFSAGAVHAQGRVVLDPRSNAAERPDKEKGIEPGFLIEAGVSSTRVTRGVGRYETKTTPATEDSAFLRLNRVGPGLLSAGTSFSAPITGITSQPKSAPELVPQVTYGGTLGPIETAVGFQMRLQPRADVVDNSYEGILRVALPTKIVTPTFEMFPEMVQRRGAYVVLGVERTFELARWLTLRPRVSLGAQGYEQKAEYFHAQDVTASIALRARLNDTFYVALRPAYGCFLGVASSRATAAFDERSIGVVALALGAQR